MDFHAYFPAISGNINFRGELVTVPKSFTEIRLDANLDAVINARFPNCNVLTPTNSKNAIGLFIEKNFQSLAISNDGMFILAVKNSEGEWVSSRLSNIGNLLSVNNDDKILYSERLKLAPSTQEDWDNIKFVHAVPEIKLPDSFYGTYGTMYSTIEIMGQGIILKEL